MACTTYLGIIGQVGITVHFGMQTLYSTDKIDETEEGVKQEENSGSVESGDVVIIKHFNTNQIGGSAGGGEGGEVVTPHPYFSLHVNVKCKC